MSIKDSGNRREFETGAVRDMAEGKGRFDLVPLDVLHTSLIYAQKHDISEIIREIYFFIKEKDTERLYLALQSFSRLAYNDNIFELWLEVSKHFEEGAKKYGERNWEKGLPISCYIDSAVRHLMKWAKGDNDERHDRAFVWNIVCLIWTFEHEKDTVNVILNDNKKED